MILTRITVALVTAVAFVCAAEAGGDPARGKEKTTQCVACHGVDGNSENPTFPRLNGQYEDYMVHVLKGYRSGERKNAVMQGFAAALSDEDIADLAAWFASQDGLSTLEGQR